MTVDLIEKWKDSLYLTVEINAPINELLEQIPVQMAINYYSVATILDEIGESAVRKYFNIPEEPE